MANAQVEKLKALTLRYGEKVLVAFAGTLCLVLLVLALTKKTIDLTPAQVDKHAKDAQANLEKRQEPDDILAVLEEQGIKDVGFEKLVDAQASKGLDPADYRTARTWVSPEPGAGLIRSQPELIAPAELIAYPGRGGAAVFVLGDDGKRIVIDPEAEAKEKMDEATAKRRRTKRNRSMGFGGPGMSGAGMGMPGMGMPGMGFGGEESPEAKKQRELREKQLKAALAGKVDPAREKARQEARARQGLPPDAGEGTEDLMGPEQMGPWKEETRGLRWVSLTGVLDHKTMRDNWEAALKNPTVAHPNYKELGLERQTLQDDGTWSDWEAVDLEKNREILFHLPETEEELVEPASLLENIVNPLPFLKSGLWERVHVASLVPKEKREIAKPGEGGMGMPGMGMSGMYGMMGGGEGMRGMGGGMMPGMGMPGMGMMGGDEGMMPGMSGMGGMGMGMGMGAQETINFQTSQEDEVMVRAIDFTVEPNTTYRFRARLVVFNPNYKREDVAPGTDTKSLELVGPWSPPTDAVTMPADVTPYAMRKTPVAGNSRRADQVQFMVTRWNPEDGVTVVRNFDAGPGDVIGEPLTAQIPTSDGSKAQNRQVDFNSHLLVVDTAGGAAPIASVGASGAPLDVPPLALLLRPDGSVSIRQAIDDVPDVVRVDTDANYKRELEESGKLRENSMGDMMGEGMGMMPGGMGMPGGMR